MSDGHSVTIDNIEINDILRNGERVCGLVETKAFEIYKYNVRNMDIVCKNIHIIDKNLGILATKYLQPIKTHTTSSIYHLITDKGQFHINGNKILDYNSCIDCYLTNRNIS
jgi:hypothetical protein